MIAEEVVLNRIKKQRDVMLEYILGHERLLKIIHHKIPKKLSTIFEPYFFLKIQRKTEREN